MARPTDEEILNLNRVPLATAARYLGISDDTIADGLQFGTYPFGTAVQRQTGTWVYDIRPQALVDYNKHGRIDVNKIAEIVANKVMENLTKAFAGGQTNGNNF